jgi:mevalonate kinase
VVEHHAHGKVILLGEHAVVYGHPALAGAIDGGVTVETTAGTGLLRVPAWKLATPATAELPAIARAYRALRERLGLSLDGAHDFTVRFGVPTGAGLGSSAAMAVALARALCDAHGRRATPAEIEAAAMASEEVIHGRPSGLDHTVAQRGGFGLFVRGRGLEPVAAARPLELVIGHTNRERDTKGRVARVAELVEERPDETRARFGAIERLVGAARGAVEGGDLAALGRAMQENQAHLAALEVSCPEIERMCALAGEAGALGAKLTGGGGGGCVIALAPERGGAVREAWERAGHPTFLVRIGGAN